MSEGALSAFVRWAWAKKIVRVLVLIACLALVVSIASIERMPEQVGRIVDATTGRPLKGVTVIRWCYGTPPFSLFDTHGPSSIGGSYVTTTTDNEGRFTLPAFKHRALTAAAWVIFKPGYMPNRFCYAEDSWEAGGCMGTGHSYGGGDPWTDLGFTRSRGRLDIGIRLFTPTIEGVKRGIWNSETGTYDLRPLSLDEVDPREQYFHRLSGLAQEHLLKEEAFVEEALKYVEGGGRITNDIWRYFGEHLVGSMSIEECSQIQAACERGGNAQCDTAIRAALFQERLILEVSARLRADDVTGALAAFDDFAPVSQEVREETVTSSWYRTWRLRPPQPASEELDRRELLRCDSDGVACSEDYRKWLLGRK